MTSGGGDETPTCFPRISRATERMTISSLHEIGNILTYMIHLVYDYQPEPEKTRFFEMQLLDMLTMRKFAGFSLLRSESNPDDIRRISQTLAIL